MGKSTERCFVARSLKACRLRPDLRPPDFGHSRALSKPQASSSSSPFSFLVGIIIRNEHNNLTKC
jgi:hypothetical protein